MKSARVAPRWFVQAIRSIDRRLTVYWEPKKTCWVIAERTRRIQDHGYYGAGHIMQMGYRFKRIFYAQDLGSRILDWLRRADMSRFRTVNEMIKGLDIDDSYIRPELYARGH